MFFRVLLPLLCLAAPLHAQTVSPKADDAMLCDLSDDQENCTRILACIGDQGRWFHGRSYGRGEGTLSGVVNDGVTCAGTWTSRNAFGLGQADVTCDDGMTVRVFYFYQDEYTGTATGRGLSNRQEKVEAWSGNNVLGYFKKGKPTDAAVMRCGVFDIPLS